MSAAGVVSAAAAAVALVSVLVAVGDSVPHHLLMLLVQVRNACWYWPQPVSLEQQTWTWTTMRTKRSGKRVELEDRYRCFGSGPET